MEQVQLIAFGIVTLLFSGVISWLVSAYKTDKTEIDLKDRVNTLEKYEERLKARTERLLIRQRLHDLVLEQKQMDPFAEFIGKSGEELNERIESSNKQSIADCKAKHKSAVDQKIIELMTQIKVSDEVKTGDEHFEYIKQIVEKMYLPNPILVYTKLVPILDENGVCVSVETEMAVRHE